MFGTFSVIFCEQFSIFFTYLLSNDIVLVITVCQYVLCSARADVGSSNLTPNQSRIPPLHSPIFLMPTTSFLVHAFSFRSFSYVSRRIRGQEPRFPFALDLITRTSADEKDENINSVTSGWKPELVDCLLLYYALMVVDTRRSLQCDRLRAVAFSSPKYFLVCVVAHMWPSKAEISERQSLQFS